MKTISRWFWALIAIVALPNTPLFGQGTVVSVAGNPPTRITDATTGELVGSGYLCVLYYAPAPGSPREAFVAIGATQPVVNGFFSAGNRTIPIGAGTTIDLFGAAWEGAHGSTYEQAAQVTGAKVGQSAIVQVPSGGTAQVRIPDFSVAPVPEPSTLVLAAMGVGALLVWRRRW